MKTKTNHKLSSKFTFFIITAGALLLFLSSYVAIVLFYKPFIIKSKAAYLNPDAQNIFNIYQTDNNGQQVLLNSDTNIIQLNNENPITIKLKPETLFKNLPTPKTSDQEVNVINSIGIIGDSISTGLYPKILKDNYQISVVDSFAKIGSTTGNSPGDTRGWYIGMQYQLEKYLLTAIQKYDYVVVFGGMNDLHNGIDIENTKTNLTNIYKIIRENKVKVVAITILPWKNYSMNEYSKSYRRWDEPTQNLNNWIQQQYAENKIDVLINAYDEFNDKLNDNGGLKPEYSADGLHLNNAGNEKLAEKIYKALTTYK